MLIDCETCAVRDLHCGDCVVTALLDLDGEPATGRLEVHEGDAQDVLAALQVLAEGGLVPRLRLVPPAHLAG